MRARHRRTIGWLLAFTAGVGSLAVVPRVGFSQRSEDVLTEIREGQRELEKLSAEIREAEERIHALKGDEKKTSQRLEAIETALSGSEKLLAGYERQASRLERDIARRNESLVETRERLGDLRSRLAEHIERIYRRGKPAFVEILFGAEDFGGALRRGRYVAAVLSAERRLLRDVASGRERLEDELAALRSREDEVDRLKDSERREESRLATLMSEQSAALGKIRDEREAHEANVERLQKRSEDLEKLLKELEKRPPPPKRTDPARPTEPRESFEPAKSFTNLKGKLVWPARGKLLASYGAFRHPRYGTLTFNSGIDIRAAEGKQVVAVAAGQVEFVDWLSGFGKTVIISHGSGYYSVYGHASRVLVAPGDRVGPGDVIALAGSTESLKGNCVHFELRKGGRAVDPIPWLKRR